MDIGLLIEDELRALGVTKKYRGYAQAVLAIELVLEDVSRLLNMTKEVYWRVAELCDCGRSDIERNLRTISHRAWKVNPDRLEEIAGYPLSTSPTASELITILASHIHRAQSLPAP